MLHRKRRVIGVGLPGRRLFQREVSRKIEEIAPHTGLAIEARIIESGSSCVETAMHCLTDFKNFAHAEVNLFEPLTILFGRNGSGKTNLIEGVELLAALAGGTPFNEITDIGRGGTFEVRGGLRSCPRFGTSGFRLQFDRSSITFDGMKQSIDYSIEVASYGRHEIQLSAERLQIGDRVFFDAENRGGEIIDVRYDNFARGNNPSCQISSARSVLSRYEEIIGNSQAKNVKRRKSPATVRGVRNYLRSSYIFDPQSKLMRAYERVEFQPQLSRNGANLSAVLFALQEEDDPKKKATLQRITETIRQVPDEPFAEIGFAETPLGDVMAGFIPENGKGTNGGRLIDARLLSDGTLRMLAVVTALETVPERSRIIIEEFDNGLHPSRAKLLVQKLAEAAARRKLNVLVTTHNPAFMDALDESQVNNALLCHRDESRGASLVTRLGDLELAGTLTLRGGLGSFVTSGALERHLAPDFAEKRTRTTREWLESLS